MPPERGEDPSPTPLVSASPSASAWRWPVDAPGRVLRDFAPPAAPWLAGHRGVDLVANAGSAVRAAGPGTVSFAGRVADRGVVTVLHPDGLRTTYLPVTPSVRRGDRIDAGDVLGVLEAGYRHCPVDCLHWSLRRGAAYLSPLLLFHRPPVRLLPHRDVAGESGRGGTQVRSRRPGTT